MPVADAVRLPAEQLPFVVPVVGKDDIEQMPGHPQSRAHGAGD